MIAHNDRQGELNVQATLKQSIRAGATLTVLALGLAGCMGGGATQGASTSGGGMFSGLFGQSAAPSPAKVEAAVEPVAEVDCPKVEIREGGTNFRQNAGQAVKVQFTIKNVARECSGTADSLVIKVGIEGIALIGAAGKSGPAAAPITISVTRGDKTIVTKAVSAKVLIPADEDQAVFRVIEDGIKIPSGKGELAVTVGFKG